MGLIDNMKRRNKMMEDLMSQNEMSTAKKAAPVQKPKAKPVAKTPESTLKTPTAFTPSYDNYTPAHKRKKVVENLTPQQRRMRALANTDGMSE